MPSGRNSMYFRVEIAGGIATGKSTLCDALRTRGFSIISEDLSENHYLTRTYNNKAARGVDVGMSFLISKASAIETYHGNSPIAVVDYAMVAEFAYNDVHLKNIDQDAHKLMEQAIDLRSRQLGDPHVLIHLHCPVAHQLANIQKRGRDFEQGHSAAYLESINDGITHWINDRIGPDCQKLSFDTSQVDVGSAKFASQLVDTILKATIVRNAPIQNPAPKP